MKSSKVTQFWLFFIWGAILLLTLWTRFYDLANKPIHFDESINGWFVMQMKELGYYKYDPNNYHGPLYFYLLQIAETIWGRSLEILRAVPASFSVLSVMLFSLNILPNKSMRCWMMVFVFFSPAFLFFGRSGIHEMPFVFFQLVWILGVLRWLEQPDEKALALFFTGLWGMITLKETFAITLFCFSLAFLSLGPTAWKAFLDKEKIKRAWTHKITILCLVLLLLFAQLFTGFFKNPAGLFDFVKAFLPWAKTGVHGNGHEKVFWYWLQVLLKVEPVVLLGVLFAFAGIFSKVLPLRLLSVLALSQLLIYSLIPYKTVWCVLSLVWGFYFVLALNMRRWKFLVGVVPVLLIYNIYSNYESVYRHPIVMGHPYVYVNSSYELTALATLISDVTKKHPEYLKEPIQVGMKEQWPWPWLLGSQERLDYNVCSARLEEDALVYFCDPGVEDTIEPTLSEVYWRVRISLRQSREASLVYLKKAAFPEVPFQEKIEVGAKKENF